MTASELVLRKEFLQFKVTEENFRARPDEFAGQYLKLHSYQLTAQAFLSPDTHNKSLHLLHMAGSGKTLSAIAIAKTYLDLFQHLYNAALAKLSVKKVNYRVLQDIDRATPSIFILGFGGPKAAFIRDLMRYPEFGFITIAEKIELAKLAKQAAVGSETDITAWKDYYSMIKRRITNKSRGGFFKFYGYDEFVNRLFTAPAHLLMDLEKRVLLAHRAWNLMDDAARTGAQPPPTLDALIMEAIDRGDILVNNDFLASLENALVICDEAHNTYNMVSKNNRGVAIQYVCEKVPSVRLVTMSATPFNNSPTEVVELLNYHLAAWKTPDQPLQLFSKRDFFTGQQLNPGALEKITQAWEGKVSFIQDIDLRYFPEKKFAGETILLPAPIGTHPAGSEIPYLKFTPCPMSELHQRTLTAYFKAKSGETPDDLSEEDVALADVSFREIPMSGYAIFDMVFPSPGEFGVFKSEEIKSTIINAPADWQASVGIHAVKGITRSDSFLYKGKFLLRETIGLYSAKAAKLLDILFDTIALSGGDPEKTQKVMIYHDRVATSGVLFYQELLLANGFLGEYGDPVDASICCVCGKQLREHTNEHASKHTNEHTNEHASKHANGDDTRAGSTHRFIPARFIVAHSLVDKRVMEESMTKYNAPDNYLGHAYMIILGSRIVRESYEFKDTRVQIIMSMPTSMASMQQIHGRVVRKDSHANLPPEMRTVTIYTLLTVVNPEYEHVDKISPEIYRYVDKLDQYKTIQIIERGMNSVAFDADIHRSITMPPAIIDRYFPGGKGPVDIFGNLYFEPVRVIPADAKPTEDTFLMAGKWRTEISTITFFIKKLFLRQPAWKYDDLWAAVRNPPFASESNPRMFSENNFIIALSNLVDVGTAPIPLHLSKQSATDTAFMNNPAVIVSRLLDQNDKFITRDGVRAKIEHTGDLYVLAPIVDPEVNPLNIIHKEYIEHIRDTEISLMRSARVLSNKPALDVETYLRPIAPRKGIVVNIDAFVKESRVGLNFELALTKFTAGQVTFERFLFDTSIDFQQTLIERLIMAGFGQSDIRVRDFALVIDGLTAANAIVTVGEIKKYKDVARLITGSIDEKDDGAPIGYLSKKSVRVYNLVDSWIDVNKISLNKQFSYKENDITIGYLEPRDDLIVFKLRAPAQKIKEKISTGMSKRSHLTEVNVAGMDTRTIEKGIVCGSKNKLELVSIMAALGADVEDIKKRGIKIHKLCFAIRHNILARELKNRKAGTREKWLYFWWDEMPSLIN